jgi:hypothetical protein
MQQNLLVNNLKSGHSSVYCGTLKNVIRSNNYIISFFSAMGNIPSASIITTATTIPGHGIV